MSTEEQKIVNFLRSYFKVHKAEIQSYTIANGVVRGVLGWEGEDDTQEFQWRFDIKNLPTQEVETLCTFLIENNLVDGDVVRVSIPKLTEQLVAAGWSSDAATQAIDYLFEIEIPMLDDGVETDSFFLHL